MSDFSTSIFKEAYDAYVIIGKANIIKMMLKNGVSKEEIAVHVGFSITELDDLLEKSEQLEHEWGC